MRKQVSLIDIQCVFMYIQEMRIVHITIAIGMGKEC